MSSRSYFPFHSPLKLPSLYGQDVCMQFVPYAWSYINLLSPEMAYSIRGNLPFKTSSESLVSVQSETSNRSDIQRIGLAAAAAVGIADTLITFSMFWYLRRSRTAVSRSASVCHLDSCSPFSRTNDMLTKLMIVTVSTGALSSLAFIDQPIFPSLIIIP